jgi:hypothetical protein
MALLYTIPKYRYPSYRPYYYPNYPYLGYSYPLYKDPKFFAMTGSPEKQSDIISGIAKVIVNNREELINKLDELKLACSCGLHEATEKDLSDIVVDNIGNKKLAIWLSEKISGTPYKNAEGGGDSGGKGGGAGGWLTAVTEVFKTIGIISKGSQESKGRKDEYKKLITSEAVKYKQEQERSKSRERNMNTLMIAGGAVLLLGVGVMIYLGSTKKTEVA